MSRVENGVFNIFFNEKSEKYHKRDGQPSITISDEDLEDMTKNAQMVIIRAHSSGGTIVACYSTKELMKFKKTKVPIKKDRSDLVNKIYFKPNF